MTAAALHDILSFITDTTVQARSESLDRSEKLRCHGTLELPNINLA